MRHSKKKVFENFKNVELNISSDLNTYSISFNMEESNKTVVAAMLLRKQQQLHIGAVVLSKGIFDLYQFIDNDQLSNLDTLFIQIGSCILYLPDDLEDNKNDGRRIKNLLQGKDIEVVYIKRSTFKKPTEAVSDVSKINFEDAHVITLCEVDRPLTLSCLACLINNNQVIQNINDSYKIRSCALNAFMRLDSAAAEAVNLLPKPDHPSQYGSLFGVLNHCKTKGGARLLERWLRQPLTDHVEIIRRQDAVELLLQSTISRAQLTEGPLRSVPDLDGLIAKMVGKRAGLKEVVSLWSFTNVLPKLVSICEGLLQTSEEGLNTTSFRERIYDPLVAVSTKFELFQHLVEHVVDLHKLPDLVVNCQHDSELKELAEEEAELQRTAEEIHDQANGTWASMTELKLERHSMYGFVLRSTKSEDERHFQQHKKHVIILSIKKNGVYCSTAQLQSISTRLLEIEKLYQSKQERVVTKALEAAVTYLPLAETASAIVSELDVLVSLSTVAALSPGVYCRPIVHAKGECGIDLKRARHPCVEMMDNVQFIANDYDLKKNASNFQIITGPNMGGKSTYIRGVGCLVVMAQIGSFIPCESAELSVVDCILARVGAGDAVQKGVSTFMAEMLEASVILQTATEDSLIIIDELGRGTSTFDGFGIARAISEYIITEKKCACLFATHFHDLTSLQQEYTGVINRHVTVHLNAKNQMTMLYNVEDGQCTQSYGIYVAMSAAFPAQVVAHAKRKAEELESENEYWDTVQGRDKHASIVNAMKKFAALPITSPSLSNREELKTAIQSAVSITNPVC